MKCSITYAYTCPEMHQATSTVTLKVSHAYMDACLHTIRVVSHSHIHPVAHSFMHISDTPELCARGQEQAAVPLHLGAGGMTHCLPP